MFGVLFSVLLLAGCDDEEEVTSLTAEDHPTVSVSKETTQSVDPLQATAAGQRLLILGDSLSAAYNMPVEQGWVSLLEKRLEEQGAGLDVVNASISGDTTAGALARLSPLLDQYQPDLVMIELGGNDGLRGLPPADMQANLRRMIVQARDSGAEVILVGVRIPLNYGPQYRQAFEQVYTELASEFNVALVPFPLEQIVTSPGYLQADGVHPTAEAQPLILDTFWPDVQSAYQAISEEHDDGR